MAKIQPAVNTLYFRIPGNTNNASTSNFIDLSQVCSIVNRRFYRQGKVWVVSRFKFVVSAGFTGSIVIGRLPSTWSVSNGWHKSYAHWKKQQDQAVSDAGAQSAVAKYRDFKIHMNEQHVEVGFGGNLIPWDFSLNQFAVGEWMPSEIVIPQAVADPSGSVILPKEYYLHMVGVNNNAAGNSRGIVEGYADSRAYPQSPDPVSPDIASDDNWLASMFDVGSEDQEVLLNATHVNDDLPYDQINYPGGEINAPGLQMVDSGSVTAQANTASVTLNGDIFPCGLLNVGIITASGGADDTVVLLVSLVPGSDRGYMTQPMQDM